jgi:transmembrane sensor
MNSNEEKIRSAIAEQAGEWFVVNDQGPLDERDSAALVAWFKTSPIHIEEFLGVSAIARDLKEARTDPQYSLEAILARAEDDTSVQALWPRVIDAVRGWPPGRWLIAGVAMAACAVLSFGVLFTWNVRPIQHPMASDGITALHIETRHGEQLTRRLADNSVVHLDTDSAVTIRYGKTERLAMLTSGQADFEVAHEPDRGFRVIAGSAEVLDLGTQFDVRLERDSTLVTVVKGRVAVGSSNSNQKGLPHVQLSADQQLRVTAGGGPGTPVAVDAQRTTAWLHRQIVFDNEPLERVAAEYNRYTSKPIEIATPTLRNLLISGVFATDDPEAFIAFLRSLKGVRVEVTETRIRVSRD